MIELPGGIEQAVRELLASAALVAAAALAGWLLYRLLMQALRRMSTLTDAGLDDAVLEHCAPPLRALMPLLAVNFVVPGLPGTAATEQFVGDVLFVLLVVAVAWMAAALLRVGADLFLQRFDVQVEDNLRARKVHTQIDIVRKILSVVVAVLALSIVFLHFERLRELGTGLLASAGIAGLVIGLAAQRTIANAIAGFQLALTQPIRLDDVLVVEGEWGRVEEITLTYVVVRIWDLRRLVLPISYFIEQPFQNWTRTSAKILGTVYLYADYTIPVEEVRETLGRILEESEHWEGGEDSVWRLHVTDATDRCMQMRALMSAPDSPTAWELRCEVREKLVAHLQARHPDALPRLRAELEPLPEEAKESAA